MTGTLARMEGQLLRWEEAGDGRAVFLDCYVRMTRAMDRELATGRFDDPAWVERLLERFAELYFVALDAWDRGDPTTPTPWVVAHEAAERGAAPVQLLLTGVNAHINYDLVLTLLDLLGPECPTAAAAEHRHRDYDLVNDVIAATADEVQDEVLERYHGWTDVADVALGRFDEWMAVRLLGSWRADVWRRSMRLLDRPDARPTHLERCARQCERRSRWILLRA